MAIVLKNCSTLAANNSCGGLYLFSTHLMMLLHSIEPVAQPAKKDGRKRSPYCARRSRVHSGARSRITVTSRPVRE